jgi:methyl-accepting chemotaxis protein
MDSMTQQNAALVEQAAAAAQSLKEQAVSLQRAAAAFQVDDADASGGAPFAPPGAARRAAFA